MNRKVKKMILLAGLAIFLMSPVIAKATPITDYGLKISGCIPRYAYAWTGTTYGNWAQARMIYWDANSGADVGEAARAFSSAGWAQTEQVSYGPAVAVRSENTTVGDFKTLP